MLAANGGRVTCNNTLEARLLLSIETQLPAIRKNLFPISLKREAKKH